MSGEHAEWLDALWFVACVAALIVLFAAGLRVRTIRPSSARVRRLPKV